MQRALLVADEQVLGPAPGADKQTLGPRRNLDRQTSSARLIG